MGDVRVLGEGGRAEAAWSGRIVLLVKVRGFSCCCGSRKTKGRGSCEAWKCSRGNRPEALLL